MNKVINVKKLRDSLPEVVEKVRRGVRFTVLYRSRPAFQVVPVEPVPSAMGDLDRDSIYRAPAVGRSTDGRLAADHDSIL